MTFKIKDFRKLLNKAIEQVKFENWNNCIKHIIEKCTTYGRTYRSNGALSAYDYR